MDEGSKREYSETENNWMERTIGHQRGMVGDLYPSLLEIYSIRIS